MAIKRVFEVYTGGQDVVNIEYNDANLRIGNINFTIPAGFNADVLIWDTGNLVFTNTYPPGSYSENVPGNYKVTEEIDPETQEVYAVMPAEIAWCVSWVKV